jgi:hypothetical protein
MNPERAYNNVFELEKPFVEMDDVEMLEKIVHKYSYKKCDFFEILDYAIFYRRTKIIEYYLKEKEIINNLPHSHKKFLFANACLYGTIKLVILFIEGDTITLSLLHLYAALVNKNYEIARIILKHLKEPFTIEDLGLNLSSVAKDILGMITDHIKQNERESKQKKNKNLTYFF